MNMQKIFLSGIVCLLSSTIIAQDPVLLGVSPFQPTKLHDLKLDLPEFDNESNATKKLEVLRKLASTSPEYCTYLIIALIGIGQDYVQKKYSKALTVDTMNVDTTIQTILAEAFCYSRIFQLRVMQDAFCLKEEIQQDPMFLEMTLGSSAIFETVFLSSLDNKIKEQGIEKCRQLMIKNNDQTSWKPVEQDIAHYRVLEECHIIRTEIYDSFITALNNELEELKN